MALILAIDDHVARILVAAHVGTLPDALSRHLPCLHQGLRGFDQLRAAITTSRVALRVCAHEDIKIFQVLEACSFLPRQEIDEQRDSFSISAHVKLFALRVQQHVAILR